MNTNLIIVYIKVYRFSPNSFKNSEDRIWNNLFCILYFLQFCCISISLLLSFYIENRCWTCHGFVTKQIILTTIYLQTRENSYCLYSSYFHCYENMYSCKRKLCLPFVALYIAVDISEFIFRRSLLAFIVLGTYSSERFCLQGCDTYLSWWKFSTFLGT
jgi:hypothetical protein